MGFFLFDMLGWIGDLFKPNPLQQEEYWDKNETRVVQKDEQKLLKIDRNKLTDNIRIFRDIHKIQQRLKKLVNAIGTNDPRMQKLLDDLGILEQVLNRIKWAPNVHAEKDTFPTLVQVWRAISQLLTQTGLIRNDEIRKADEDIHKQLESLQKIILGEQTFMLHKLHILEEELTNTRKEIGEAA